MLGLVGLLLSLFALMYFAYRGINVLILAPLCALLAVLMQPDLMTGPGQGIVLSSYTGTFMGALSKYLMLYFPVFLLGSIFGKLMDDTKAAESIGIAISKKLGPNHAILATVLACCLLTYGGVSLFVVAFCVYPIAVTLFKEGGIHPRYIPGAIALGAFTLTMTALPGTPSVQNAIPMPYFGTTSFAAPGLGTIAGFIMLGLGMMWMKYNSKKTPFQAIHGEAKIDTTLRPSFLLSLAPLLVVVVVNFAFSEFIIPKWDAAFLLEKYAITLTSVKGLWAIIISLAAAIIFIMATQRKYATSLIKSLNEGTMSSLLPIFNTASEVGYGAVIASLASFTILKNLVLGIFPSNPLVSEAVAVNMLAGITGSASGGLSIALEILGKKYLELATALQISPELLHRVASLSSGGFDTLPHNGAVITLLTICGMTHKDSYKDIFMVAVAIPVVATAVVVILGSMFGSF
ncbi:MAG: GntP family permease [Bacteriovoracaceae bacterium]